MEANGDRLADYFALKFFNKPQAMRQFRYRDSLALYKCVLAFFQVNPLDHHNLYRGLARCLANRRLPSVRGTPPTCSNHGP